MPPLKFPHGFCAVSHQPLLLLLLLPFLLVLVARPSFAGPAEDRLSATLLKGYNPLARPVEGGEAVDVRFGMGLIQVLQIVEVEQTVKVNVWLRMWWYDMRLTWDPEEYDGLDNIRVPIDSIWNPEIVLFNNANGVYEVSYKSNAVIYYYGMVLWVPPALFVSSCSIDVRYFPFDEQKCEMIFGSWTYNSDQVKLLWYDEWSPDTTLPFAAMSDYVRSGSWDLTLVPGIIKTDEERKTTNTEFTLHLRRKTLFFILNLIVPCVVIAILCWFTFLLPSTSGEKVGFAITLLLGLMVFLLLLFDVLPATSASVPLMAQFLLFIYIVNVVSIILCVWIIGYTFRLPSTHVMSDGIRALYLELIPKIVRMKRPEGEPHVHEPRFNLDESIKTEETRAASMRGGGGGVGGGGGAGNIMTSSGHSMDSGRSGSHLGGFGAGGRGYAGFENMVNRNRFGGGAGSGMNNANLHGGTGGVNNSSNNNSNANALTEPLPADVIQAAKDVRYIAERASGNNTDGQVASDWVYIGLVLDSLTFWITGMVIVGGTAYFLMSAPNSFGSVDQLDLVDNWAPQHCRIFYAGDYELFSYKTADPATTLTMRNLCCRIFYKGKYYEKSSKYSCVNGDPKEIAQMDKLCDNGTYMIDPNFKKVCGPEEGRKKRSIDIDEGFEEGEEEEEEEFEERDYKYVSGVRGGGGPVRVPTSAEAREKHRQKIRQELENKSVGVDEKFQLMGLDFEEEWKKNLRDNLVLMRDGERELERVKELANRKPRAGLRHNASNVG